MTKVTGRWRAGILAVSAFLAACRATVPVAEPTAATPWPALDQALSAAAAAEPGVVGAAVIHLPSGRRASLHGRDRFLMASVYKVPIALALLDARARGEVKLVESVLITKADVAPGVNPPLGGAFTGADMHLPLSRLLELMVGASDNTATDVVLRRLGGPATVSAYLGRVGHGDVRVDRNTATLYAPPGPQPPPRGQDLRDTTTPEAMASLLAALADGRLGTPEDRDRLLGIMTASTNQVHRLAAKLPPGTAIAHKSGTASALATNMVGLITLPPPQGQLAVAFFVAGSPRPRSEQEVTIATLARAAYDEALR